LGGAAQAVRRLVADGCGDMAPGSQAREAWWDAQMLRGLEREFESTERARQAAARERAQMKEDRQRAEQAVARQRAQQAAERAQRAPPKTREAADRVAAEIMEEEEREQAAQTKVRLAPPSLHIWLHSVCSWVVSDAAFLSHG
jgi:hypothetical protein